MFNVIPIRAIFVRTDWAAYQNPDVLPICKAFIGTIPGRLGIVDLSSLPEDTIVTIDDRKGTGKASVTVQGILGPKVDFTIALLGPNKATNELELWTFHPGAPVPAP